MRPGLFAEGAGKKARPTWLYMAQRRWFPPPRPGMVYGSYPPPPPVVVERGLITYYYFYYLLLILYTYLLS